MSDLENKVKDLERRIYNLERERPIIAIAYAVLFILLIVVAGK